VLSFTIIVVASRLHVFYKSDFKLPFKQQEEFDDWLRWTSVYHFYRILLGIQVITIYLTLLMLASQRLPSLGILGETIYSSRGDLLVFTLMVTLCLFMMIVACNALFGSREFLFHTLSQSFMTNIQMMLGVFPYQEMYNANYKVAAVIFLFCVFFFVFFVMSMYTAIMIRTYNKLRPKKFFVSEAIARILWKDTREQAKNLLNLIFCRNERGNRPNGADGAAVNNEFDDENIGESNFTATFKSNFAKAFPNDI